MRIPFIKKLWLGIMAFSLRQWETVKAFFERGLSLAEIVARPEVEITDRSSISKRAKIEGWKKGEKSTLVQEEIQAKQKVALCVEKNQQMNSTELEVHKIVVSELMEKTRFYDSNQRLVSKIAIRKLTQTLAPGGVPTDETTPQLIQMASSVLSTGRSGEIPKVDTAIQINNSIEGERKPRTLNDFYRRT